MTERKRVLVTGVTGGSIGEQVCKALRSGRGSYEIVAANTSLSAMAAVRAEHYELLPVASAPGYTGALRQVLAKHRIDFLVPGSEPELVRISREREEISRYGARILVTSAEAIRIGVDKCATARFLAEKGFPVPVTLEVGSVADVAGLQNFPYIVKPVSGGGSASTYLAQDRPELDFFAGYLLKYGRRIVVQEYFGTAQDEYTVGVLHYPDRTLCGSVVLHRSILDGLSNRLKMPNRTGRDELGQTLAISSGISQGRIVSCEPVRRQCEAIAAVLGSAGPLNIQGRWFRGVFMPFEINPRFSGTTPMRAVAGFNEPELLIEWYAGVRREAPPAVRQGVFSRGLVEFFTEEAVPPAEEPE
jgi:carbamoyl-phosphate synthase large subunit